MKRFFLTALIVVNIFISYSQKTTSLVNKSIVGEWQWINSVGGFTGHDTLKPGPNTNVLLIFNPDQTYKRTLNEKITEHGSYEIINVESIFDKSNQQAIRFSDSTAHQPLIINLDEPNLTLSDNHVEAYVHFYKRVK
jgi:hypothetical protein